MKHVLSGFTLSWPVAPAGFMLQPSETIPAASWQAVPGVEGTSITLPVTGQARFYRLVQ